MAVNKVIYDGDTLVDLTADTVTPETLMEGITAHDATGESITGLAREITVDGALSETSANPVQNKVINAALLAQKITVDGALSETSTNPVQNKVVNTALANRLGRTVWRAVNTGSGAIAAGKSVSLTLIGNSLYLVFMWSHAAATYMSAYLANTYAGTNSKVATLFPESAHTAVTSGATLTMTGTSYSWNYIVCQL